MKSYDTHEAHDLPTEECTEYVCNGILRMTEAAHVTDEVIEFTVDMVDAEYGDSPIDWQHVFDDRLDGMYLNDGRNLALGDEYDSPAMRKVQREVRKIRSQG
jgi:hypothetical protein